MRIKRPPPQPPQDYRPPVYRGAGLGARQAEYAARARQAWTGKSRDGKKARGSGIHDSTLVTEFDEAMDEAYDRLLGRRRRQDQQQQQQEQRDAPEAEEAAPQADKPRELPAAFRFTPVRIRG